ncbi:MAG: hypothetical protein IJT15_04590 [Rickettsiales bacterium]|nr:hypothetical protein [Rickettsiales bacterium]
MNNTQNEQLPDMNAISSLLGGMQNNKKPETPDNSKPKTYEEYKKEKEEKINKDKREEEYQKFKQSMQRAEEYLKQFDKANLSNEKKKEIEDLKRWTKGGSDIMEKLQNVTYALNRFVDIVFSVVLFGFAGVAAERQIQNDKNNMAMILKNKMGIKLEGKDKEMFDRYQQEKQQEAKEKEEKKKKQQTEENKEETHIEDNKSSKDTPPINRQNNNIPKIDNDKKTIQNDNEKATFLDNWLALNEEKKQQAQQQKQDKWQEEKPLAEDNKQTLDNTNDKTTQENNKENTKFLSNETNDVEITDKQKMDVDKLLIKKQAQSEEMSNKITNQLKNINQIDGNNNEITEEKGSDGNDKNNDALKQKNDTKMQEQQNTQKQKMMFNMEQKPINNAIPNNKQNTTKVGLK